MVLIYNNFLRIEVVPPQSTKAERCEQLSMNIIYSSYHFKQTGEIFFATDADWNDVYIDMIRNNYAFNNVLQYALQTLSRTDKFIDVGANIGFFTIPIAKRGTKTLAIEALPDNCLLLLKALQRNGIDNAVVLHAAAHDSTGMVRMTGHRRHDAAPPSRVDEPDRSQRDHGGLGLSSGLPASDS